MLIENDVIFAYMNELDPNHGKAEILFSRFHKKLNVEASSACLLEMELIFKSEDREDELLGSVMALKGIKNIKFLPITPEMVISSIALRRNYNLTFFDSHHAATALSQDRIIISTDAAYDVVPNLTRYEPDEVP
ncbi:MAG: PIN domain-containing protein [Methanocellales archaeon]|nr:PIN domain-containing protein [Methanocellales archaeon]